MIGHILLTIPLLVVAPSKVPHDEALDIVAVDSSAFPTIVAEFVWLPQYSAIAITKEMVEIDGAAVDSVTRIEPDALAVALIVDDRPEIDAGVVAAQQSGAVELVRILGAGPQIALATPSGLQTAFTTDQGATIARASGITAGATAVTPLSGVIIESAAHVAASGRTDRHLVVEVGGPLEMSEREAQLLSSLLVASGTTLHVIAPLDVDVGPLGDIAARTGGSSSAVAETVAGSDRVTAAILNRYRVVATVADEGPYELGVDIGGRRLTAIVDMAPATPSTTSGPTTATTDGSATSSVGSVEQRSSTPVAEDTAKASAVSTALARSGPAATSSAWNLVSVVAAMIVAFVAAMTAVLVSRRRRPSTGPHPSPDV